MELQEIHKEILDLCNDDDTGLWLIIKRVAKDAYSLNNLPVWVRLKTIEVLSDLLGNGLIEAGYPNGPKFRPISLSADEAIAYIQQEWDKLERVPNIGDICWFRATSSGEHLAEDLGL
jgi:hypothetical protein